MAKRLLSMQALRWRGRWNKFDGNLVVRVTRKHPRRYAVANPLAVRTADLGVGVQPLSQK
jgi:hypothetical protein